WGRPRPRQVQAFGGTHPFIPFYQPSFHALERFKSFPSGHSSMGFYFFSLVFLGRQQRNKKLVQCGWGMALGLGAALSLARIAQGGHFLSDTLFSGLIMWGTAWALAKMLLKDPS
ncbi:MAG: phosphatase PAP2 family protein, partial [Parachlamydia sp.]|nr:phosphatase PAP2 family protein [Parachlamydia sp.]